MRAPLFMLAIIIILSSQGIAQDVRIRKNTISIEHGIFSRGLYGASYSRKFVKWDFCVPTADVFAGFGRGGSFYGAGWNVNFGNRVLFAMAGLDFKWYELKLYKTFFYTGYYSKGLAINPYLGASLFTKGGFTLKIRGGFMPVYKSRKLDALFPTVGISLGHSF